MTRERLPILLIGLLLLSGCGGERDPVVEMQKSLASAPAYMIVLDDMREEGTLFTTYYHRYLITQGEKKGTIGLDRSIGIHLSKIRTVFGNGARCQIGARWRQQHATSPRIPLCGQSELRTMDESRGHIILGILRPIRAHESFARLGRRVRHESLRLRRLSVLSPRSTSVLRAQSGVWHAGICHAKTKTNDIPAAPGKHSAKETIVRTKSAKSHEPEPQWIWQFAFNEPQPIWIWQPQFWRVWKMIGQDLIATGIYLISAFILFWIGKLIKDLTTTSYSVREELVEKDNVALGVAMAGYYFGLIMAIGGTLSGPSQGLENDLIDIGIYGLLAIILLNLSRLVNDWVILHGFKIRDELIDDQNAGTGVVVAASYIATGTGNLWRGIG